LENHNLFKKCASTECLEKAGATNFGGEHGPSWNKQGVWVREIEKREQRTKS